MKKPYPWFHSGRSWYFEIDGPQHFLGRHPDDGPPPQKNKKTRLWNPPQPILDGFYEKMREPTQEPDPFPPLLQPCPVLPLTVAKVCDRFLEHSHRHNDPKTYHWYKGHLDDLCNHRDEDVGVLGLRAVAALADFPEKIGLVAHLFVYAANAH